MDWEQMGITLWRQRSTQAPVAEQPPKLMVVAQTDQLDQILLNNILKALNCSTDEAKLLWVDRPEDLNTQAWPKAPVIVFGEALHAKTPSSSIKTLSLMDLNQNIAAKKALWAQLKALL